MSRSSRRALSFAIGTRAPLTHKNESAVPLPSPLRSPSPLVVRIADCQLEFKPSLQSNLLKMMRNNSSNIVVDEMFPDRMDGAFEDDIYGLGPSAHHHFSGLEQGSNEKFVHTDFYNAFDDLFDDEDFE